MEKLELKVICALLLEKDLSEKDLFFRSMTFYGIDSWNTFRSIRNDAIKSIDSRINCCRCLFEDNKKITKGVGKKLTIETGFNICEIRGWCNICNGHSLCLNIKVHLRESPKLDIVRYKQKGDIIIKVFKIINDILPGEVTFFIFHLGFGTMLFPKLFKTKLPMLW